MNDHYEHPGVGGELGNEATTHVEHRGGEYCAAERERIELANQPSIIALRARIASLQEVATDLEGRIWLAPPPGAEHERKRKAWFYWAITAILSTAGFVFAVIAFEPFQLGWKAWLYCAGIAVMTPFLVERCHELWANPRLVKAITAAACVATLTSGMILAVIRGDLLTEQLSHTNPVATIEAGTPTEQTQNTFYERTLGHLRLVMALLAFALEVGAGIALHEARRWSRIGEDGIALRAHLTQVHNQMIEHAHNLRVLENEGVMFERQFRRDFSRSLLNGAVRFAARNLPLLIVSCALLMSTRAFAVDHVDLVVFLDLSASEAAKDGASRSEFQKNIDGVTSVLAALPAGSRVTIYGVTSDTFGKPYPLLTAQLTDDEGYFKERLAKGRAELVRAWQERSRQLQPTFPHTDLLGAFLLASQQFAETKKGYRKVLVVFSDMRQSTPLLDLEHGGTIYERSEALRRAEQECPADLHGIEIYALGVDANGVSLGDWRALQEFWLEYLRQAGANAQDYSILRELPNWRE